MPSNFEKFVEARGVRITSYEIDQSPDWGQPHRNYKVTLTYQRRRYSLEFRHGLGIEREPDAASVLACLISDAESVRHGQTFEEWATDLGYDVDSRKAERTYRACIDESNRLERLLGDDYQAFVEAAADY